jgi:hypothetical protein
LDDAKRYLTDFTKNSFWQTGLAKHNSTTKLYD